MQQSHELESTPPSPVRSMATGDGGAWPPPSLEAMLKTADQPVDRMPAFVAEDYYSYQAHAAAH